MKYNYYLIIIIALLFAKPSLAQTVTSPNGIEVKGSITLNPTSSPFLYTGTGTTNLNRYLQISNASDSPTIPSGIKAGGLLVSNDFTYANPNKNDLVVSGKVLIGTPKTTHTPDYVLAVNGKIGAKDLRLETTSDIWPDYVFESNYKLLAVNEIAKYIREHKHLPGIPSAQEVEKNGYSVNELDVQLLKKVEELTLYIIEQQRQIDELKKKLEEKR